MSSKERGFVAKHPSYQYMVYPFSRLASGMNEQAVDMK